MSLARPNPTLVILLILEGVKMSHKWLTKLLAESHLRTIRRTSNVRAKFKRVNRHAYNHNGKLRVPRRILCVGSDSLKLLGEHPQADMGLDL